MEKTAMSEGLYMAAQQQFTQIPDRLNDVERTVFNLEHRLEKLEGEKLPSRVEKVELVVGQVRSDVSEIREISKELGKQMQQGIGELKGVQDKQQRFIGMLICVGLAFAAFIKLSPTLVFMLRQAVKQ